MLTNRKWFPRVNGKQVLKIGVLLVFSTLLLGNLIALSYGIENLRIIQVFSSDEFREVGHVLVNLENDDLNPGGYYNYGYCYQTIGFFIVKALKFFGFKVDAMLVALVLRLISLASYALAGFIIYKIFILSFKGSVEFGWILGLFLLSIPSFSFWSRFIHPDTLQVFLIEFAVLAAFLKPKAVHVFMGSALAGAAFGTKYSGIFILPFLVLPYFLYLFVSFPKDKKFWLKVTATVILALLIFAAAWIITNPYVLKNYSEFKACLTFEKEHVARGHGKAEPANPFLWFDVLKKTFGTWNCIIIGSGLLLALGTLIFSFKKEKFKKTIADPVQRNLLTLLLYSIGAFLYLMLEVRMREPRYLFHILPFILLIAIYGFQKGGAMLKSHWLRTFIIIGLFISVSGLAFQALKEASIDTLKHYNPRIEAGNFLARQEDCNLIVLANSYSYVPPQFKKVAFRFRIDEKIIKEYRPDIIILNTSATRRWSWKKRGTLFRDLNFVKGDSDNAEYYYQFHKKLFSAESPWKIIFEAFDIVILKKARL